MSTVIEPKNEERKPFTDVDGKPLKFCDLVEILKNGVGPPGQVICGKVVHPGPWISTIEYNDGRRINSIENKNLRVKW